MIESWLSFDHLTFKGYFVFSPSPIFQLDAQLKIASKVGLFNFCPGSTKLIKNSVFTNFPSCLYFCQASGNSRTIGFAKFSFFLSAPVVCGALLLELLDKTVWSLIIANLGTFILGIVISFITGLLCIKYLLKYLQKHNFKIFMIYRLILSATILLVLILR